MLGDMQANNKAEFFRLGGGDWLLWLDDEFLGTFPSKKAAKAFLEEG